MQPAKPSILIVAEFNRVVARLGGRERVMQTVRRNGEFLRTREPLFQHRMVSEVSVVLTRQHGDIFPSDEIESDVFDRDALELRIDRDEIESALFVPFNVVQNAVRFSANHEWEIRKQGAF